MPAATSTPVYGTCAEAKQSQPLWPEEAESCPQQWLLYDMKGFLCRARRIDENNCTFKSLSELHM